MSDDIFVASEELLRKLDRIGKFGNKYGVMPYQEANRVIVAMRDLAGTLPAIEAPENDGQLLQAELKRRLDGEAFNLEQSISPGNDDFDTTLSIYNIPRSDICGLKGWLVENREKTLEAIERLFDTKDVQNYELGIPVDIPAVRRQAEEFAAVHIQKYHKRLGRLLQEITAVGEFLRDIDAVPTTEARSYFNQLTNTLAIGIPAICFTTEEGNLQIRERDLITLYGHEGMGHALNMILTKRNGLPYFLARQGALTLATMESVAQYYQEVIFEDLRNSPDVQKDLGIQHKFEEIYQERRDIRQLQEYVSRLSHYTITVLADKSLGEPQDPATLKRKVDALSEVTLHPYYPQGQVEQSRYSFDSQGNLSPGLVSELRYCAQPVKRAIEEFASQGIMYEGDGRSKIDAALLRGFWTPKGFVDNARLRARER